MNTDEYKAIFEVKNPFRDVFSVKPFIYIQSFPDIFFGQQVWVTFGQIGTP
jgi:hypothetical protein